MNGGLIHPAVRQTKQFLKQPQLMEKFQRRRMHRISPKIAEEIRVFLQHSHCQSGTREQQSCHHPRWTAANNQNIVFIGIH